MKIWIDVDNTICSQEENYADAKPYPERIIKYNRLYEGGHHITYWTARGTTTGIDWRELTESQLEKWGVKYHELKFDKPDYDLWIDDKALNPMEV